MLPKVLEDHAIELTKTFLESGKKYYPLQTRRLSKKALANHMTFERHRHKTEMHALIGINIYNASGTRFSNEHAHIFALDLCTSIDLLFEQIQTGLEALPDLHEENCALALIRNDLVKYPSIKTMLYKVPTAQFFSEFSARRCIRDLIDIWERSVTTRNTISVMLDQKNADTLMQHY